MPVDGDVPGSRERELEAEVEALRQRLAHVEAALEAERAHRPADPLGVSSRTHDAPTRDERGLLQTILDTSPAGILVIDGEQRVSYASARACEILGLPRECIVGSDANDPAWDVHLEDGRPMRREDSLHAIVAATRQSIHDACYRVRSHTGGTVWLSMSAAPLVDDAGRVGVLMTFHDVTARKLAEEGLRRTHRQLKQHLTNTPLAAVEFDADFRITAFNRRAEEMFGFAAEEMIGRLPTEVRWVPQEFWPEVEVRMRQAREGSAELFGYNPNYRKDGTVVHCEWHISSLYDFEGRLQSVLALAQDVTARLEAERALSRQVARYRTLVDMALDGIHLVDGDGYLVEANPAFYDSLGYTAAEAKHMHLSVWNRYNPVEDLMERVRSCMAGPLRVQTKHRRKDGTEFDVDVTANPIDIEGRTYVLSVARDITAQKTLERRRRRTMHKLERRVAEEVQRALASEQALFHQARLASMGEMLGRIAHQWRQPLNVLSLLMANLRDVREHGELDAAEVDAFLERAALQVRQMSSTISDFIQFTRPDKEAVAFDVLERVRDAVALVAPSLRHQGVEIRIGGTPDLRTVGHPNEYAQVVLNLLSNARDAILERGVAEGLIDISVAAEGAACRLSVADNGGGVPDRVMAHIFEPYFTTRPSGTGLGLYMSRSIIAQMGGALGVRNEGPGAVLTITTPLASKEEPA